MLYSLLGCNIPKCCPNASPRRGSVLMTCFVPTMSALVHVRDIGMGLFFCYSFHIPRQKSKKR